MSKLTFESVPDSDLVVDQHGKPNGKYLQARHPDQVWGAHDKRHAGATEKRRVRHETWGNCIRRITGMTVPEVEEYFGKPSADRLSESVGKSEIRTVRELMVLRAIEAFVAEPNASIWHTIMERDEGKVPEKNTLDVNVKDWRDIADKAGRSYLEVLEEARNIIEAEFKEVAQLEPPKQSTEDGD